MQVSPFAPKGLASLPAVEGVLLASASAGIRYRNRPDVALAILTPGTTVAGVLTRSKTASAPVDWCRANLITGQARALVVNSGNSNAFTGRAGVEAVRFTADEAARAVGCRPSEVFIASTGVIGEALDARRIADRLGELAAQAHEDGWEECARAIMTTDTFPKLATRRCEIGGAPVKLNGFAKGSGMIQPDMATLLAFVFTDASIEAPALQTLCAEAADASFNAISVDGDTSTSDTLLAFATGAAAARGAPRIVSADDERLGGFRQALVDLMLELAWQVVKDGEGASKFITIRVEGAESAQAARRIGFSIANSPLVKTAIAGHDPNWGRIVMAVGKSGEAADRDKLAIRFGALQVATAGAVDPAYREARGAAYLKGREIDITVDVGVGRAGATVWTCDLTQGYVSINANYRS